MIGQMAGNYKILSKLGEGGMGTVWKGLDVMVEREVAVKMLRPEIARMPEIVERFRSEAVTLAKLNHPSIATLFSFFAHGTDYFMVMEFVPGKTLDAVLRECGPLPVREAAKVMIRMLDGIEHAHELGILHRDIKPANIMLTPAGAVKVTDFGIARVLGQARMTREGHLVGTLEYLAPERIRGQESDPRSDIYSLGAVFYEMLTGRVPFEANTDFELMRLHLESSPRPLSEFRADVPGDVEAALMRALAKDPGERFTTAGEFRDALIAAVGPITSERTTAAPAVKPTRLAAPLRETRLAETEGARSVLRRLTPLHFGLIAAAVVILLGAVITIVVLKGRSAGAGAAQTPATPPPQQQIAQPPAPAKQEPVATTLPEELQPKAPDVLKTAVPVTGEIPSLGGSSKPKAQPPAARPPDDKEARRRATLRALGVTEGKPEQKSTTQNPSDEERRKKALKALEGK